VWKEAEGAVKAIEYSKAVRKVVRMSSVAKRCKMLGELNRRYFATR
jgi:hypothetical protein